MNLMLDPRYTEVVHRLAVGLEPRDALRVARVRDDLRVTLERPRGIRDVALLRHPSARWSVRYVPRIPDGIDVRLEDPFRRLVPRRLRLPVVPIAEVESAEAAGTHVPQSRRTWRPVLFPAAAYAASAGATGLRLRVTRDGVPARWTRATAVVRGTSRVVGRGHGDDRGEVLLLLAPDPQAPAELPNAIAVTVSVRGADPAPAVDPRDPLADLPIETPVPPGPDDPVCAGTQLPAGYEPGVSASRDVALVPGRIQSLAAPFELT